MVFLCEHDWNILGEKCLEFSVLKHSRQIILIPYITWSHNILEHLGSKKQAWKPFPGFRGKTAYSLSHMYWGTPRISEKLWWWLGMSFFCTHYGSECVIIQILGPNQLLFVFPVAVTFFFFFWFAFHKIISLITDKLYFQVVSSNQAALRCVLGNGHGNPVYSLASCPKCLILIPMKQGV